MTQQRSTLSIIGLVLVIAAVGLTVRYVQSLDLDSPQTVSQENSVVVN